MTSLAAALAVDQRGPSALYLITDSRITFAGFPGHWDAGQKTFASQTSAHIFGFCGNAAFPPAVIRQVVEQIDRKIITQDEDPSFLHRQLVASLGQSLNESTEKFFDGFSVFHGARQGELMASKFRMWKTDYFKSTHKFYDAEIDLEKTESCLAHIDGSGRTSVKDRNEWWNQSSSKGTSRAAIMAFCEALSAGRDKFSGGSPQLVGIWRKGIAQRFGLIWNAKRYVSGLVVRMDQDLSQVNWFNDHFEVCDGYTMERKSKSSIHMKL